MQVPSLSALLNLHGKVAIVTGAGRGIGEAVSQRLAEAGAAVVLTDIDFDSAQHVAEEIRHSNGQAAALQADASSVTDANKTVAAAISQFGRLDILVNNAAIFVPSPVMAITEQMWDRTIAVDLKGVFIHSQAAAKTMIEAGRGGKIINIASVDALLPVGGLAVYDAAKGGVVALTRSLAKELGKHNIQVNAVAPGGINTPGAAEATPGIMAVLGVSAEAMGDTPPRSVLGRWGEPDDIAKAVYFLASGLADYVTGNLLIVDGGYVLI